jgi:exopolyphosphatase/guanosine-5'-triphosphate,3'-diphosphate pyrophosphatase
MPNVPGGSPTRPWQKPYEFKRGAVPAFVRRASQMAKSNRSSVTIIAAIDAGSNGMRLAIGRVGDDGAVRELENLREPVRLGGDAFASGQLSEATMDAAVAAFQRFAGRIKEHEATHVRAVATSAAREASNSPTLVARIRKATGIRLEIIDGLEEAQLIFAGVAGAVDLTNRAALLIDMGGGSVEVTVARDGLALGCETLGLGAVRLLAQMKELGKSEADVGELVAPFRGATASLVKAEIKDQKLDVCIGTGGNLECLGRLRVPLLGKEKLGKVKLSDLDVMIDKLLAMTPAQRTEKLGLRPDRADVVAIAAIVLRMVMQDAGVTKTLTPGVGLNQGILRQVANRVRGSQ